MNSSKLSLQKKIVIATLVGFFFLMAIATVIAQNVYYDSLPTVKTELPTAESLKAAYSVNGSVVYKKLDNEYYADFDFGAVRVLAENGKEVAAGDPLYAFDTDEILLARNQMALSAMQLEDAADALDSSDIAVLQKEINWLEIGRLEKKIALLDGLHADNGVVKAVQAGTFFGAAAHNSPVLSGQKIGTVVSSTRRASICWQLPVDAGQLFHVGDEASATITVKEIVDEETIVEKNMLYKFKITEAEQGSQFYSFTGKVGDDVMISMEDGASATVNCSYTSKETYPIVVPLSAVTLEDNGITGTVFVLQSRDRMFGEELYVVPYQVEISYMVGNYAAITNLEEDAELVTYSTIPLADKMAVKKDR